MSFSQALSGLSAQGENLRVISNNIANSQTVGFKGSRALFADIFAGAGGGNQAGLGVRVADIMQDFSSGALENTARNLDLAIAGRGFFRMEKPSGEIVYTRNGQFNQNAAGFIENANGQLLTGFGLDDPNDPFSPIAFGGAPQPIRIPQNIMGASATTEVDGIYNLDARVDADDPNALQTVRLQGVDEATGDLIEVDATGAAGLGVGDVAEIEISYHYTNSYTAFDSLGNQRTITTYFQKVDNNVNGWRAIQSVDGQLQFDDNQEELKNAFWLRFNTNGQLATYGDLDVGGNLARPNDEVAGVASAGFNLIDGTAASPILTLDPNDNSGNNNGRLFVDAFAQAQADVPAETSDNTNLTFNVGGGANDLNFIIDLPGTTQFSNASERIDLTQNGFTSGSLIGIEIADDGRVVRIFSNEQRADAGQITLTNFINPEGLAPDGDNAWRETGASGLPNDGGIPGQGLFGAVESQTLESSNVDLATELVNMIIAQRAFQANSTSIGTQDENLQTIINL